MGWFILIIGLSWLIIGTSTLLASKKTTSAICNLVKNSKHQTLGLVVLIFGAVLLLSAVAVKEPWFVLILGIIAAFKGATLILMPTSDLNAVIDWWLSAPEIVYKGWAILIVVLGVVMLYIR